MRTGIPLKDTTEEIQSAHFLASLVSKMFLTVVHWETLKILKLEINFVRRNFPKIMITIF